MEIFKKYDFSGDTLDFLPIGNHVFTYLVKAFVLWMSWIHLCVLKMNSSECPGVFTPKASTMTSPWTNWEWGGLQHLKDSGIGHLYVYSSCTLFCNSMSDAQIFVNKTTKNHRKYLLFHLKCSYFWTKAPKLVIWWLTKEKILLNILNISEHIQQPEKGLVPVLIGKCP